MDHIGFGFDVVLAGLLPLGMDHFGSGLEMVLARGRGVPLSASSGDQELSREGLLAERRRRTRNEERTWSGPLWLRLGGMVLPGLLPPGLTALAFAWRHGPTRGERGSFIGSNPGQEDHQEGVFAQNGVVDRRHDSTRSPFLRRKRNRNSRRNLSRIDEEGIRRWLQVGARTIGRGIGGIQR